MYGTCTNCGNALYGTTPRTMTHLPGAYPAGTYTLAGSWECPNGQGKASA